MSECMLYFGSISYNTNTAIVGYDIAYLYLFSYKTNKYKKLSSIGIQNVFIFDDHDYVYVINNNGLRIYFINDGEVVYHWNQKAISSISTSDTCISINGITMIMHDWRVVCKYNILNAGSNSDYTWLHYNDNRLEIMYKQTKKLDIYYNVMYVCSLREAIYFTDYNYHYRIMKGIVSTYCKLEADSNVMSGGIIIRDNEQYYLDPLSLETTVLDNMINSLDDYKYLLFEHESGLNIVDPNYGFVTTFIPSLFIKKQYKFFPNYLQIDGCLYSYSGLNISSHKFCERKDHSWYYNVNFPL